jgi:hypothetical protein
LVSGYLGRSIGEQNAITETLPTINTLRTIQIAQASEISSKEAEITTIQATQTTQASSNTELRATLSALTAPKLSLPEALLHNHPY